MAEGKRPGGLTALAVLNFVFAGLGLIIFLGALALLGAADHIADKDHTELPAHGVVYLMLIFGVVRMALLIVSGVGYLAQKRKLGRTYGNAYGVLALISTVIELAIGKGGFGIGTIIGLVYPVLTLILLNSTFKDDLVN